MINSKNNINSYLQENKDKFSKEVLIEELRKTGYGDEDIKKEVEIIYNEPKSAISNNNQEIFNLKQLMIIGALLIPAFIIFYKIIPDYSNKEFSFVVGIFLGAYVAFIFIPLVLSLIINFNVYYIKKYNTKIQSKYSDGFPLIFLIITIIYSILMYSKL